MALLLLACGAPVPPQEGTSQLTGFLAPLRPLLHASESAMLPMMAVQRWAKQQPAEPPDPSNMPLEGVRYVGTRPTHGAPADYNAAMMQAGNGVHGMGGVVGIRGKSLRRLLGINQRRLMADRVIPSPFMLGNLPTARPKADEKTEEKE